MNVYEPYSVIEDSPAKLHVAESRKRRTFLFVYYRVFPVFLLILLAGVYYFTDELPALLRIPLLSGSLLVAVLFIFYPILNEIEITPRTIVITYGGYSPNVEEIPVSEISHIRGYTQTGRGGGQFFFLVKKQGGKVRFFTIPVWYMKKENFPVIRGRLKQITGLEIKEK